MNEAKMTLLDECLHYRKRLSAGLFPEGRLGAEAERSTLYKKIEAVTKAYASLKKEAIATMDIGETGIGIGSLPLTATAIQVGNTCKRGIRGTPLGETWDIIHDSDGADGLSVICYLNRQIGKEHAHATVIVPISIFRKPFEEIMDNMESMESMVKDMERIAQEKAAEKQLENTLSFTDLDL